MTLKAGIASMETTTFMNDPLTRIGFSWYLYWEQIISLCRESSHLFICKEKPQTLLIQKFKLYQNAKVFSNLCLYNFIQIF